MSQPAAMEPSRATIPAVSRAIMNSSFVGKTAAIGAILRIRVVGPDLVSVLAIRSAMRGAAPGCSPAAGRESSLLVGVDVLHALVQIRTL